MSRRSAVLESIDRATKNAQRTILGDALSSLPASTTIQELQDAMSKSDFGEAFRSMTLAEFVSAVGQKPAVAPSGRPRRAPAASSQSRKRRNINTRTAAGRAALDTAVRDFLRMSGPARSEGITPAVPGDTAQVRQSPKRLIEAGEVVVKGSRRASEYRLTSRASRG